jgi:endo-1,4-beta-xylanase
MVSNYILIIAIILSFGNNSSIDSVAYNQEINTSLSKVFKDSFDIGAAVSNSFTNSSEVKNILKTHFTSITAENEMKPESLLKKNGGYNWRQADAIIDFARKNKIKVRGHTLLWHKQTPSWFFTDAKNRNLTKEGLYLRQFNYMKRVMNHFDYIKVWDVVNEAITDNNNSNQIFRTKNSKWFEICGEEFIEKAFIMAHSIGPDKKLFYNDYNLLNKKKTR